MKHLDECWSVLYIETSFAYGSDDPMKDFMTMEFKTKESALNFIKELKERLGYQFIGVFKSFYIEDF